MAAKELHISDVALIMVMHGMGRFPLDIAMRTSTHHNTVRAVIRRELAKPIEEREAAYSKASWWAARAK